MSTHIFWHPYADGTYNRGHNKGKRRERAEAARFKGSPGGWKKALRRSQQYQRCLPGVRK